MNHIIEVQFQFNVLTHGLLKTKLPPILSFSEINSIIKYLDVHNIVLSQKMILE